MNLPQRRPLALSSIKHHYRTADACRVQVGTEVFNYRAMCAEHYEDLLRYVSRDALEAREFLFDGTGPDWEDDGTGSYSVSVYVMGWPGGPKFKVKGAKAAVAALRRFWPLRDHEGDDSQPAAQDTASEQPEAKVVPFRDTAAEIRQRLRQADADVSPGRVF
jgi:hypothetical protein